ncbi:MAG: hypothetical protein CENE_01236 [Candidatus Celerinatantimonas neptuna]|nr:MAG: hypothetical protein CENE_01236 [Candidatus Celerinatantimonas neptuna]
MMHRNRGFTLLEVLLVIMLIGLGSSAVILSMGPGSRERELEQKVRLVSDQLRYARDESVLSQIPLGLKLTDDGYQFYRYKGNSHWKVIKDRRFKPVHGLRDIILSINGKPVNLDLKKKKQELEDPFSLKKKKPKEPTIQLVFSGDGIWPLFKLDLGDGQQQWQISSENPNGQLELNKVSS